MLSPPPSLPPSNQIFPSQPPPPPPSSNFRFPTQPAFPPSNNFFGSKTQTLTLEKEKTKDEKESDCNKIYELPEISRLELGDCLTNIPGTEGEEILEDNFLQAKGLENKNIEEIKEKYEFNKIKDAYYEGAIPSQLFYGREQLPENFKHTCNFLSLNDKNIC